MNIIAIDYHEMNFWNINYFLAASNIKNLGQFVGDILKKVLILDLKVDQDKEPRLHIIGIILKHFPNLKIKQKETSVQTKSGKCKDNF